MNISVVFIHPFDKNAVITKFSVNNIKKCKDANQSYEYKIKKLHKNMKKFYSLKLEKTSIFLYFKLFQFLQEAEINTRRGFEIFLEFVSLQCNNFIR